LTVSSAAQCRSSNVQPSMNRNVRQPLTENVKLLMNNNVQQPTSSSAPLEMSRNAQLSINNNVPQDKSKSAPLPMSSNVEPSLTPSTRSSVGLLLSRSVPRCQSNNVPQSMNSNVPPSTTNSVPPFLNSRVPPPMSLFVITYLLTSSTTSTSDAPDLVETRSWRRRTLRRKRKARPRAEQRDNWISLLTVAGHLETLDSMPMLAEELDLEEDQLVVSESTLMLEVVLASTDVQSPVLLFPPEELFQVANESSESRPRQPEEPDPTVDLSPSKPVQRSRDNNVEMFHPSRVQQFLGRVAPPPTDNSAHQSLNSSAKMCQDRSTGRNVPQFPSRVADLFLNRNVELCLSSLVDLFQSRSVEVFPSRNVDKSPSRNVEMYQEKNVELFLDSLVALFPNSPADLCQNSSVAQFHGNSA